MTREEALRVIRGEINLCEEESVDALELEDVYSLVEHSIPLDRIKQAMTELDNAYEDIDWYDPNPLQTYKRKVDEVFSKLITEVERGGTDGN